MTVTHVCPKNEVSDSIRIVKNHSYSNWAIRSQLNDTLTEELEDFAEIEITYCPFCGIKLTDLIKEKEAS